MTYKIYVQLKKYCTRGWVTQKNVCNSQNTFEFCLSCFRPGLDVISSHVIRQAPIRTIADHCHPPLFNPLGRTWVYEYFVTYTHIFYFVTHTHIWLKILWLTHTFSILWITHNFRIWQSWCSHQKLVNYLFVHCWPCESLTYIQNNSGKIFIQIW